MAYDTEEQQVEAIKKWWHENGKAVIVMVAIAFATVIGAQSWFKYKESQSVTASMDYASLSSEMEQGNTDTASLQGAQLMEAYPGSPYATLAAFALMKQSMEAGDKLAAKTHLRWILDNSALDDFKHMATISLAKIMLDDGEAGAALALLNGLEAKGFEASTAELKGDIFMVMEKPDQANTAYKLALKSLPDSVSDRFLKMKIDSITASQ